MAHPDKAVLLFGSDGSQMEGNDAEAARLCVARKLKIFLGHVIGRATNLHIGTIGFIDPRQRIMISAVIVTIVIGMIELI